METKKSGKLRLGLMMLMGIFCMQFTASAQKVTYNHDKSKMYQYRSMENGKWEFHPGLYYVTLHKKYSGGYWKGLNIRWSVNKSSVGQMAPLRAEELANEKITSGYVQNQIDSIKPLAVEETLRAAERMVDVAYPMYQEQFDSLLAAIDKLLLDTDSLSEGELALNASRLLDEKELLVEEIEYIHQQGPTNQMEHAKRELAYEEVLRKLKKLSKRSYDLAYYAQTLYNLKH